MHLDIVEAVRQKQYKKQQSVRTENGDLFDISMTDGRVVVVERAAAVTVG
jgi:hypothetical protein